MVLTGRVGLILWRSELSATRRGLITAQPESERQSGDRRGEDGPRKQLPIAQPPSARASTRSDRWLQGSCSLKRAGLPLPPHGRGSCPMPASLLVHQGSCGCFAQINFRQSGAEPPAPSFLNDVCFRPIPDITISAKAHGLLMPNAGSCSTVKEWTRSDREDAICIRRVLR